jgi:hypothetical protein
VSRTELRVGDVFSVPLDERRFGLGQVVALYGEDAYFFALFEPAFARSEPLDLEQALQSSVAFLGLSLDARIAAGQWTILGHHPVPNDVPLPAFKEMVGGPERVDVVDFSGNRRRPASREEAAWLPNRKIVAPVRLERALKAKHGLEPWKEEYGSLEPSPVGTTARFFG